MWVSCSCPSRSAAQCHRHLTLIINDTDPLINAFLRAATRFSFSGNFRIRLATHLP
jgi:hypothetical protein